MNCIPCLYELHALVLVHMLAYNADHICDYRNIVIISITLVYTNNISRINCKQYVTYYYNNILCAIIVSFNV